MIPAGWISIVDGRLGSDAATLCARHIRPRGHAHTSVSPNELARFPVGLVLVPLFAADEGLIALHIAREGAID